MRLPALLAGGRRAIFVLLLLNGFAQGGLAVLTAWLVMRVFELLGAGHGSVATLFAGLVLALLATAVLRRSERVHAELLGQRYVRSVRGRLYRRLLSSSPRAFTKQRKGGVLLKFVGDLSALRRWISLGLARLLVAGVAVSIALAALLWLYWPFAIGVVAMLAISATWILWQGPALRHAIAEVRSYQSRLASNVTEKLNSLATVQAFGRMNRERRLIRRQSDRLVQSSVDKAAKIGSLRAMIEATAGGCVIMVLALAFVVPPADLTPGMVAAVISIIGFLTPPLRDLGRVQEYWLAARVARENLQRLARSTKRLRTRRNGRVLQLADGAIVVRGVTVRGVFADVDASVAGRSRVALVGANGSGKSTLLSLIGRLSDPDGGHVLIDDQDVARVRLSSLRRHVAYVGADIPLIRGSLRKNLCYGNDAVDDVRLRRALRDCELDGLVKRLKGGLQAGIAEGGRNLSQGERMRVALARALLRDPGILLLDEADANLDDAAFSALDRNIGRFAGTVVMATHRASMLQGCDTRWTLHDGRLTQEDGLQSGPDALDSVEPLHQNTQNRPVASQGRST